MSTDLNKTNIGSAQRKDVTIGLPRAMLVERADITSDLFIIKLKPEQEFKFKPGLYCTLGLEGIERAYSIVSAPHEPLLEIFVEVVPEGELTPRMWRMKVGDSMSIRPRAKGLFTLDEKVHHHLMLATVTGVAPYVSILRDHLFNPAYQEGHRDGQVHKFYVILGASYDDELTYDRELSGLAEKHPDFIKFVATVSRPNDPRNAGWTGAKGRVNLMFEEYLEKSSLPKEDSLIYACGHPGMIADVKEKVVPQRWKFKEERFWKE